MTKHTKKLTIGLIVALIGPGMIFAGCGRSVEKVEVEASKKSRFMNVEDHFNWCIYADRETGVMYAVSGGVHNCGDFTLLVDANGNPLIYEGDMND